MGYTKEKQLPNIPSQKFLNKGWDILTKELGYAKAVRFVTELPKQTGDSVKEIREMRQKWSTVAQLDKEIRKAKKK